MGVSLTLPSFLPLSLLLLLLLSSAPKPASSSRCNKDDKKALLAIKTAFNNAYHFASWTPDTGCCDWYDIECDPTTNRVTGLSIFADDDVTGTIPAAVGDLPYLTTLTFHKLPKLTGTIPPQITRLTKLRFLTVSWTNVSGTVPSFIADLPSLENLDLSFGNFSGPIPASLGGHPKLNGIDISRNHLTGSIPATLMQNVANAYLILSHNELSGPIPPSFGSVDFTRIDLSRNRLTGDASFLFGPSKGLQQIDLSRNQLEFDLSPVVFPEGELIQVDLNHNMVSGSIPTQITKVPNLQFFNVSYNRLCGEIPTGGQMGRFDEYCFLHNKCLCGTPLPPCNDTACHRGPNTPTKRLQAIVSLSDFEEYNSQPYYAGDGIALAYGHPLRHLLLLLLSDAPLSIPVPPTPRDVVSAPEHFSTPHGYSGQGTLHAGSVPQLALTDFGGGGDIPPEGPA